jgi:ATP-dependent helicase/nuclease subunit B
VVDQGAISIIDYKSGQIPSAVQVRRGDKIQLPMEAIIAENGGFGLPETTVKGLYYIDLKKMEVVSMASTVEEVSSLAAIALERLEKLIYRYNVAGEAYKVNINSDYKSYLHLARAKEYLCV